VSELARVAAAELAVRRSPAQLECLGLGSCVAIILRDATAHTAGVAHVLLPAPAAGRTVPVPARYAVTAVPALVAAMRGVGAPGPYEAVLVGGAALFGTLLRVHGTSIGAQNVEAARQALEAAGIPVRAEDVLGEHARSVRVVPADGRVAVRTLAHGARVL
jgi:chemotaxis protein CheD